MTAKPTDRSRHATREKPPVPGPVRGEKPTTQAVMLERRLFVLRLLENGATKQMIRQACTAPPAPIDPLTGETEVDPRTGRPRVGGLGISEAAADYLIRDLMRARRDDFEAERRFYKSEQAARLRTWIAKAASSSKWSAVASLEEKLARVLGTYEPITVRSDDGTTQREAIMAIVGRMSDTDMDRLVAQQAELEQRAARALLIREAT